MKLTVKFQESPQHFDVKLHEIPQHFSPQFGEIHTVTEFVGGDPYKGEYIVTPKVEAQTMPTKNKVLTDDVTIKSIPYFNVSNNSGGSTVYIGNEV